MRWTGLLAGCSLEGKEGGNINHFHIFPTSSLSYSKLDITTHCAPDHVKEKKVNKKNYNRYYYRRNSLD